MLAIIGGSPARFAPFSQLFRQALEQFGRSRRCRSACTRPGHVAATDEQAREEFWPRYREVIAPRQQEPRLRDPDRGVVRPRRSGRDGALLRRLARDGRAARSPRTCTSLGATRFDLKYGMRRPLPRQLMTNIEVGHAALAGTGPPMPYFRSKRVAPERGQVCGDLLRDGLRRPDVERPVAARSRAANDSSVGIAKPRILLTERDDLQPARPELLAGLLVGGGDVARASARRPGAAADRTARSAWRKSSENGANRAGDPPMIASISENP